MCWVIDVYVTLFEWFKTLEFYIKIIILHVFIKSKKTKDRHINFTFFLTLELVHLLIISASPSSNYVYSPASKLRSPIISMVSSIFHIYRLTFHPCIHTLVVLPDMDTKTEFALLNINIKCLVLSSNLIWFLLLRFYLHYFLKTFLFCLIPLYSSQV